MTTKIIKCAACGYEYDEGKPSWEQLDADGYLRGEFIGYEIMARRLDSNEAQEEYILVCPVCKTLRLE